MRVLSAKEQSRMEQEAFAEGVSDEALMEKAGYGVACFVEEMVQSAGIEWCATLLCGKGNNGGDAYVTGRHLIEMGYKVRALQLAPITSPLCQKQHDAFVAAGGEVIDHVELMDQGVILDGLLGTGFSGEVSGLYAEAITVANGSNLPKFAIDIPSGVNGTTGEVSASTFSADWTIYLEFPKTGFFIGDAWNYVGDLHRVALDLPIKETSYDFEMMEMEDAAALLPHIVRNRHKYQAGYVVGLAGSPKMPGAAILACEAALRSGAGMMRLFHPAEMKPFHMGISPEVLVQPYDGIDEILEAMSKANALFIGPGIGRDEKTMAFIKELLPRIDKPCVIDADALTLLGEAALPSQAVLTPHAGEMCRLLGKDLKGRELIDAARAYAKEKNVVVVLKGAPSFVFGDEATVIPKGDPGMATAGSGDVLTGIIASLLAQGLKPFDAARLGVYVHGEAGEQAAFELTSRSLVASDITHHLPEAFQILK